MTNVFFPSYSILLIRPAPVKLFKNFDMIIFIIEDRTIQMNDILECIINRYRIMYI